jgi:hypothetical protein
MPMSASFDLAQHAGHPETAILYLVPTSVHDIRLPGIGIQASIDRGRIPRDLIHCRLFPATSATSLDRAGDAMIRSSCTRIRD